MTVVCGILAVIGLVVLGVCVQRDFKKQNVQLQENYTEVLQKLDTQRTVFIDLREKAKRL